MFEKEGVIPPSPLLKMLATAEISVGCRFLIVIKI